MSFTLKNINVIVTDDHPLFREALVSRLREIEFIGKIIEASDGDEVLPILQKDEYHALFIDVRMRRMQGDETIRLIRKHFPKLPVVALSQVGDDEMTNRMQLAGCNGFVLKESGGDEIINTFKQVLLGQRYFDYILTNKVIERSGRTNDSQIRRMISFTPLDLRIIRLIYQGKTHKEIAVELKMNLRTEEKHRERLYAKAGVHKETELIRLVIEEGFIDLSKEK